MAAPRQGQSEYPEADDDQRRPEQQVMGLQREVRELKAQLTFEKNTHLGMVTTWGGKPDARIWRDVAPVYPKL
ncbi:hypothetical protein D3C76_715260 [compost metagenome]